MSRSFRSIFLAVALAFAVSPALLPAQSHAQDFYGGGSSGSIAERAVNDFSSRLGISREAAAGMVGNFSAETDNFQAYGEYEPVVAGSRGGAGFAQWTGPRRVAFENFAAERGLNTTSYEANMEFAVHEMTGEYSNVLGMLRNTNDPAEAAYLVRRHYEAPLGSDAGPHHSDPRRIGAAEAYAAGDFSGTPGMGAYDGYGQGGAGAPGYAYGGFGGGGTAESQPAVTLMPWGSTRSIGAYPQGTT